MDQNDFQEIEQAFNQILEAKKGERTELIQKLALEKPDIAKIVAEMLELPTAAMDAFEQPIAGVQEAFEHEQPMTIGPYRLQRELGRGGMGVVYLAHQIGSGFERPVALKVTQAGYLHETLRARFAREIRILAKLKHNHIAQLYDGGTTEDGRPYYVLEYISGKTLFEYCEEKQPSLRQRIELFTKICSAVSEAHRNLIVHSDLKPANILITNDGEPKLLDFGIAKILEGEQDDATLTHQARPMTPAYAAPEQLRGEQITTACDVYSLGLILYELLTGHRAERRNTVASTNTAESQTKSSLPNPSKMAIDTKDRYLPLLETPKRLSGLLRGDLDNVVMAALRPEPQRRYVSVNEFRNDLENYLKGMPVKARGESFFYVAGKFIQRHRTVTAVFATALVADATVGAVTVDRDCAGFVI